MQVNDFKIYHAYVASCICSNLFIAGTCTVRTAWPPDYRLGTCNEDEMAWT